MIFSSQLDDVWGCSTLSGVGASTSDVTSGSSGIADDISVVGTSGSSADVVAAVVSCISDSVPETSVKAAPSLAVVFSSQLDDVWGCSALSGVGASTSDVTSWSCG